jgi:hypothetical protein
MADSVAYKKSNNYLAGTFIPEYSSVALGLSYSGKDGDTFPNYSGGYGSTIWKNGIEIGGTANGAPTQVYYTIYSDEYSQDIQPNPSLDILPLAWVVVGPYETDILNKINDLPEMTDITKHSTYSDAIYWLIGQNKYIITNRNYPSIGYRYDQTPLVAVYDPTFIASYPFVGKDVYDLTGKSASAALTTAAYWDSSGRNSFVLTTGEYIVLRPTLLNSLNGLSSFTVSMWFNPQAFPPSGEASTLLFLQDASSGIGNKPSQSNGTWLRVFLDDTGSINIEGDPKITNNPCQPAAKICDISTYLSTWVSLIFSVDENGNMTIVLNGSEIAPTNANFNGGGSFAAGSPRPCSIGAQQTGSWGSTTYLLKTGFNGNIGATHIYSGSLTADEMTDLYTKTVGLY